MTRLKSYWIFTLAALMPLLLAGCGGEPFTNSFAPAEGDARHVEFTTSVNIKLNIMNNDINQSYSQEMAADVEVTEVMPDGNVMLQVTIDRMALTETAPQIPGMDLGNMLADMQKASREAVAEAAGEQFALKVGPDGEIILSENLMDLSDRVKRKASISGGNAQMVSATIDRVLDDKAIEESIGTILECYRNELTKQGDTWTATKEVDTGLPIKIDSTYTLSSLTDKAYEVAEAMALTATGTPPGMGGMPQGMNIDLNVDMTGTGTATHTVDRASTWLQDYRNDFTLSGTMQMSGIPGAGGQGLNMTVSGTTTATVTPM